MIKIKRALISVSDKTGLEEFVKGLNKFKVEILSTGGTAKLIEKLGIPVRPVSEFTGSPEMLDGRVKTLHPKIHGALLALRDKPEHIEQIKKFNLELIDMVVVNLYPFEKTVNDPKVELDHAIENIDIGGPSMLRSAAKNSRSVAVICNPQRYQEVLAEMNENDGQLSEQTCFRLAVEVFERTSEYDQAIAAYLKTKLPEQQEQDIFPEHLNLNFLKVQSLRYGENPHQPAAFYKQKKIDIPCVTNARQLQGKELYFNNILDLHAALNIVKDFNEPAASIIKHTNPCGAATAKELRLAYKDALDCDPLSAFGSIVGLNKQVDKDTASEIISADFVECIIAPGFSPEARNLLQKKKNLRVMEVNDFTQQQMSSFKEWDIKRVDGGILIQDKDLRIIDEKLLKTVTKKSPTADELASLIFAWKIVKHVKSNAIVLAKGTKTVGIGAGQMSRVDSVIISIQKSQKRCQGAVLASDAFFPKEDAVEEAAKAGITAIIQPGGSIRDPEVIQAADKLGLAMIFTGLRHFKH